MTRFNTAAILAASLLLAVSGTGCFTWPNGIEPVQPKYGQYVTENPLVLEWLPAKTSIVLAESGCIPPSCSTLIRYHLAIFDSDSKNVYEVKNLVTTSHNVPNMIFANRACPEMSLTTPRNFRNVVVHVKQYRPTTSPP